MPGRPRESAESRRSSGVSARFVVCSAFDHLQSFVPCVVILVGSGPEQTLVEQLETVALARGDKNAGNHSKGTGKAGAKKTLTKEWLDAEGLEALSDPVLRQLCSLQPGVSGAATGGVGAAGPGGEAEAGGETESDSDSCGKYIDEKRYRERARASEREREIE